MTTVAAVAIFAAARLVAKDAAYNPHLVTDTFSVDVATRTLKQVIHLFSAPLAMLMYALGTKHLFWHTYCCVCLVIQLGGVLHIMNM